MGDARDLLSGAVEVLEIPELGRSRRGRFEDEAADGVVDPFQSPGDLAQFVGHAAQGFADRGKRVVGGLTHGPILSSSTLGLTRNIQNSSTSPTLRLIDGLIGLSSMPPDAT